MNRHKQREYTFRLVFSLDLDKKQSKEEELEINIGSLELKEEEDKELLKLKVTQLIDKLDVIDPMIVECAMNWTIDRIAKIELALLRVAIFEIMFDEIPISVAINEAVELSKIYGENNSSKFVNGILGEAAKRLS